MVIFDWKFSLFFFTHYCYFTLLLVRKSITSVIGGYSDKATDVTLIVTKETYGTFA